MNGSIKSLKMITIPVGAAQRERESLTWRTLSQGHLESRKNFGTFKQAFFFLFSFFFYRFKQAFELFRLRYNFLGF